MDDGLGKVNCKALFDEGLTDLANSMLYPNQISGGKVLCALHLQYVIKWHSHLNDMEILGTKRFILKIF